MDQVVPSFEKVNDINDVKCEFKKSQTKQTTSGLSIKSVAKLSTHPYKFVPKLVPPQSLMKPQVPENSVVQITSELDSLKTLVQAEGDTLLPKSDNQVIPHIQNIVCTSSTSCKLDLKKIVMHARNAEYNPRRFNALVMRIREPRTTALIFNSGKIVCLGASSEKDALLASRKYARIIEKIGFSVKFGDFQIRNLVATVDVKFLIRLEGLQLDHKLYSSYEPELFPGLIYRMVKPHVVLLIFVSGKIVITGAKTRAQVFEAFNNIYPVVSKFKKSNVVSKHWSKTNRAAAKRNFYKSRSGVRWIEQN